MSTNPTSQSPADSRRGLPRPTAPGPSGGQLPVPWILSWADGTPQWKKFDPGRADEAKQRGLCQVCGLELGHKQFFPAALPHGSGRETSGPATHLRCGLLTVGRCPRFAAAEHGETVGWIYSGPEHGAAPILAEDSYDPYVDNWQVSENAQPVTIEDLRRAGQRGTQPPAGCPAGGC